LGALLDKEQAIMSSRIFSLIVSASALAFVASAASAADLPSRYAPVASYNALPSFTWTGFYAGAQAGYAWGADESRVYVSGADVTPSVLVGDTEYDTDGFVGGVHAGYNYQYGTFVAGVEGDLELAGLEGNRTWGVPGDTFSDKTEIGFQGSIRGRVGVALDRLLVYGTGGLAFAKVENTYTTAAATTTVQKFDEMEAGWTLGAGAEYAFTNNLTARAEYRYSQLGKSKNDVAGAATIQQDPDYHAVRMGLSYKFSAY
jgi:outer membrane immunogenic protein